MTDLIMILGNPASGKSTLARRLCAELALPCLCKDDVKEALFDMLGTGDRERSRRYSDASFAAQLRLARTQLDAGLSCVLEGNWRAEHAAGLRSIAAGAASAAGASTAEGATPVRTAQVWCRAPASELARRFKSRSRHPGHLDAEVSSAEIDAWVRSPAFLDLPGPRWIHGGGRSSYERVVRHLKAWRATGLAGAPMG